MAPSLGTRPPSPLPLTIPSTHYPSFAFILALPACSRAFLGVLVHLLPPWVPLKPATAFHAVLTGNKSVVSGVFVAPFAGTHAIATLVSVFSRGPTELFICYGSTAKAKACG